MNDSWNFAIDRGGTFTDVVAYGPGGRFRVEKLLSENSGQYADAASEAIRRVIAEEGGEVGQVRMGTTVATNALLERKGARVALAITAGFGDALRIGYQARPEIFARNIVLPEQPYETVVEIGERVGADGTVIRPLDEEAAQAALQAVFDGGIRALAIILMHGWKYRDHERRLAAIAAAIGFAQVSVSHEVAPLIKLVGRGDTTVVDAYLSPVLRDYVARVAAGLPAVADLKFMQSNGGLAKAGAFRGKDAILSGPAGGVVGMVAASREERLIGFDMGGTSTDVSHYAGRFELAEESVVAGVRIRAPMMQINTVAAGGGSICRFDGMRFRVGPESAGADPGPACYRRGGPLTVTDCNLFLGRIVAGSFPAVFGPNADLPLDPEASRARLQEVADQLGGVKSLDEIAEGFLAIAVDNMANAIRKISIARGHDVTRYALACFGGAGGQHACAVADELGMTRILIHPLAGVLSAYGIGLADVKVIREASLVQPLGQPFEAELDALEQGARQAMAEQGVDADAVTVLRRVRLRLPGSDTSLELALDGKPVMAAAFHEIHRKRFGYVEMDAGLIVEALVVEAIATGAGHASLPATQVAGEQIEGPTLIFESTSTIVVEPGWTGQRRDDGMLVLERTTAAARKRAAGTDADPVTLEIFNNLFMAIAE